MDNTNLNDQDAIIRDSSLQNQKIKSVPKPKNQDTDLINKGIASQIAEVGDVSKVDISAINSFTSISQTRDQLYQLLDVMGDDPTVAAVLETYAEDATEYNDKGQIIWVESDDANIGKYITFLLDSMKVDKNAYKWAYSLCKYGDIYWELFKQSEYSKDDFFDTSSWNDKQLSDDIDKRKYLKESIDINLYKKDDHYVHYIEQITNPATMFELTKFGKTAGYIQTDISSIAKNTNTLNAAVYTYKFKKDDINIYNGDKFVHASLEDNSSRVPEEVELFRTENDYKNNSGSTYTVRRGQSLLYNVYKIWRELSLLENSMLLNRITKSSIIRIISVEVGDMPKEDIRGYLSGIKQLIEQKSAINTGNSMDEYTNPGPIENNIYVPTRNNQGTITTSEVGGDINVGQLPDIDYFTNKYYGALRVPKQYFGFTDDGAGFNGGQSLSIISSRYAKMIKRIQNTLIQGITDVINLMLIDKGLQYYLGKFTIKMQPPTTQEEIDRRENSAGKVGLIRDIMDLLADIEEPSTRLKILKILLSSVVSDSEVTNLIEEEIVKLENETIPEESEDLINNIQDQDNSFADSEPLNLDAALDLDNNLDQPDIEENNDQIETNEEDNLPTPEELGDIDFTDNEVEI